MVALAGCIPMGSIPVAKEATTSSSVRCEPLPAWWNPTVGPGVGLDRVNRLGTALASKLPHLEIIPARTVWNAVMPGGADRATAPVQELVARLHAAAVPELRPILLVVVEGESTRQDPLGFLGSSGEFDPFLVVLQRSRCEAALIPTADAHGAAVELVGEAEGKSRSAWIFFGPRLSSTVDTLETARAELADRIAAEIAARSADRPLRIVLIGTQ